MKKPLKQFRENLERVRHLSAIYIAVKNKTTDVIDLSDILRSELVLAVSALDHFVHEIVRKGMLESHDGLRNRTKQYLSFQVPLNHLEKASDPDRGNQWLDQTIREKHGWKSFQDPNKISQAIRLIADFNIWNRVGERTGKDPQQLKQQLKAIVDRRNKIAHEADLDHTAPGSRWPIDETMVNDSIDYLEWLANKFVQALNE